MLRDHKTNSIFYLLFFAFNFHLLFNIEEISLINEIMSLTGIISFTVFIGNKSRLIFDKTIIYFAILVVYGGCRLAASLTTPTSASNYEFIRTTTIYYSIFTFFVGINIFPLYERYFIRLKANKVARWILVTLMVAAGNGRSAYNLIPFLVVGKRKFTFLIGILMLYALIGADTAYAIVFALILLAIFYRFKLTYMFFSPAALLLLTCVAVIILKIFYSILSPLYTFGLDYYGDLDKNSIWRLMYWAYLSDRLMPDHLLFGIGFGTPIFDISDPNTQFIVAANAYDPHLPYVHSSHNSALDFFTRFGGLGYSLLCLIIGREIQISLKLVLCGYDKKYLAAFMIVLITAGLNAMLISPKFSSVFWVFLGLLYASNRHGQRQKSAAAYQNELDKASPMPCSH